MCPAIGPGVGGGQLRVGGGQVCRVLGVFGRGGRFAWQQLHVQGLHRRHIMSSLGDTQVD